MRRRDGIKHSEIAYQSSPVNIFRPAGGNTLYTRVHLACSLVNISHVPAHGRPCANTSTINIISLAHKLSTYFYLFSFHRKQYAHLVRTTASSVGDTRCTQSRRSCRRKDNKTLFTVIRVRRLYAIKRIIG